MQKVRKNALLIFVLALAMAALAIFGACNTKEEEADPDAGKVTITFDTGVEDFSVEPIFELPGTEIYAPVVQRHGYVLLNWLLDGKAYKFSVMPEEDLTLVAEWKQLPELTNLPVMLIDLTDQNGNTYPLDRVGKDSYVNSTITLANTEAPEHQLISLKSEFKGRGNGSWSEAKKGYKIKFDKKQSLFGRAANKHWVILACANFDDVTMYRNYLAFNMANVVFDGIEYTTTAEWVDIYVNGVYHGVYILCEHVRVGDGRVDIKSEYGVEDTGYLIEYDAYAAGEEGEDYFRVPGVKYGFTLHSPDPEDDEYLLEGVTKAQFRAQVAYIKDYVTRVYTAALQKDWKTFSSLADVDSFLDMYILHELFKNVDTGWSSFYLYKKPGGKLYAGPAWDFDATCNISGRGDRSPQGIYVAGSVQTGSGDQASELFISLYQTPEFRTRVNARWQEVTGAVTRYIEAQLSNEMLEVNRKAMGKNFALWKNRSQTNAEGQWVNDCKGLKKWFTDRIAWLNNEWK